MVRLPNVQVDTTGIEEAIDAAEAFERSRGGIIDPEYRQRVRAQLIRGRVLKKVSEERIGRDKLSKGQKQKQADKAAERSSQVERERRERDAQRDRQVAFDLVRRKAQSDEAVRIQEAQLRRRESPEGGVPSRVSSPTRISNRLSPQGRLGGFGRITRPSFETREEVQKRKIVEFNQQAARDAVRDTFTKQNLRRQAPKADYSTLLRDPYLESPSGGVIAVTQPSQQSILRKQPTGIRSQGGVTSVTYLTDRPSKFDEVTGELRIKARPYVKTVEKVTTPVSEGLFFVSDKLREIPSKLEERRKKRGITDLESERIRFESSKVFFDTAASNFDLAGGFVRDVTKDPVSAGVEIGLGLATRGGVTQAKRRFRKTSALREVYASKGFQRNLKKIEAGIGIVVGSTTIQRAKARSDETGEPFARSLGGEVVPLFNFGLGYGSGALLEKGSTRFTRRATTADVLTAEVEITTAVSEGRITQKTGKALRNLVEVAEVANQRKVKVPYAGKRGGVRATAAENLGKSTDFGSNQLRNLGVDVQRPIGSVSDVDKVIRGLRTQRQAVKQAIEDTTTDFDKVFIEDFSVGGQRVQRGTQGEVILPKGKADQVKLGEFKLADLKGRVKFAFRPFAQRLVKDPLTGRAGTSAQEELLRKVLTAAEDKPYRRSKDISDAVATARRIQKVAKIQNPIIAERIKPLVQSAGSKTQKLRSDFLNPKPPKKTGGAKKPRKSQQQILIEDFNKRAKQADKLGDLAEARRLRERAKSFEPFDAAKAKEPSLQRPSRFSQKQKRVSAQPPKSILRPKRRLPSTFFNRKGERVPSTLKAFTTAPKPSILKSRQETRSFIGEGKGDISIIQQGDPSKTPSILKTPETTSFVGRGDSSIFISRLGDPPRTPRLRIPRGFGAFLGSGKRRGSRDRRQKTTRKPSLLGITLEGLGVEFKEAGSAFGAIGIRGTKRKTKKKVKRKKKKRK